MDYETRQLVKRAVSDERKRLLGPQACAAGSEYNYTMLRCRCVNCRKAATDARRDRRQKAVA